MTGRTGRLGVIALFGLSQGLGPGLTAFALPLILRANGMTLGESGLATLLIWPVALKFLIGPAIDRYQADGLRRGWLLAPLQLAFTACFVGLALVPPEANLIGLLAIIAMLNVLAAVLDVALGGFAVRVLAPDDRSLGQALQLVAYYAGTITASGGLLTLVELTGWQSAVLALATIAAVAACAGLLIRDVKGIAAARPGWREFRFDRRFVPIAAVALLLDLPQNAGIALLGPFLHDGGLSIAEAARVTGGTGLVAAAGGALAGGLWARRARDRFARLVVLGAIQALALLPLAALAPGAPYAATVGAVCLATASAGAFNAALGAWFMDRVRPATAATDLAVLGSLHGLSYVVAGPLAGHGAELLGIAAFLSIAAFFGLAALLVLTVAGGQYRRGA